MNVPIHLLMPIALAACAAVPASGPDVQLSSTLHELKAQEYRQRAAEARAESAWHAYEAGQQAQTLALVNQGRTYKTGPSFMGSHCELLAMTAARDAADSDKLAEWHSKMSRNTQ